MVAAALFCSTAPSAFAQDVQSETPAAQTPEDSLTDQEFDPETPLEALPGLDLDWPEISDPAPTLPELEAEIAAAEAAEPAIEAAPDDSGEPLTDAQLASDAGTTETVAVTAPAATTDDEGRPARVPGAGRTERDINYTVELVYSDPDGLSEAQKGQLSDRFNSLSKLTELQDDLANVAQVSRRAEADRMLLDQLLRIYGFYDAETVQEVARGATRNDLSIAFDINLGPQYRYSAINLFGLDSAPDAALLREIYGLGIDNPINSDDIVAAGLRLDEGLAENGYAFFEIGEPELVIDHATATGDLNMPVMPNGKYNFGQIVTKNDRLLSARHLQTIARFRPGDVYRRSDMDDLRRAIIATGLVSSVTLTPVPTQATTAEPAVDIQIETVAAPLRTISGELGYGSGEGYRAGVQWEHRNFFPPEGAITLRAVAGTKEQLGSVLFRRNNFRRRDQVLTAQLLVSNTEQDAFEARTVLLTANIERQTNLIFQKKWTYSFGFEVLATQEKDSVDVSGRRTYFIGSLPLALGYDGSNDLFDPTTGFRLGGRLSPEASLNSGTNVYGRAQIDASYYQPFGERLVLAGRVRVGTIMGADLNDIAPSRRFYAGGGGSVRGYGFQSIGPRDINNDPTGGRSLTEFSLEARVRFGAFGVVPFIDAGEIGSSSTPGFSNLQFGAGIGVRYYSSFGPLRVDLGTPLNRRPGDSRIGVYISLGQAF